ncbi:MAG: NnrS family protein, partial [Thiovulaceae bacterium]|nr:NnrS family protein [Sulfurimonadaceae bacterium]
VESTAFHSYSLIYIVFTQFFTGFIFTTFPRFLQAEAVAKSYYLRTWIIQQLGALLFILGAVTSIYLLHGALLLLFFANVSIVYKLQKLYSSGQSNAKEDPRWILAGFYLGLFAHLLYMLYFLKIDVNAVPIAVNLYLVYVTFVVGQRMVPFFSHSMSASDPRFAPAVFIGLVLKTAAIYLDLSYIEAVIDVALGLYIALEIRRWKLPFKNSAAILKVLHVSLYWLVAALLLGGAVPVLEKVFEMNFLQLDSHLLALGFVTTMLIGFGTRVTLGHSGQPPHADSATLKIFYLLQAVVIGRILFSLAMGFDTGLFWMFDLSITLWLLLFIFWAVRFGPVLISGRRL